MRQFKPNLTLRLPVDLLPRLNAQMERFPYSNPHALGLHFLTSGLIEAEVCGVPFPTPIPARRRPSRKGKQ